MTQPDSIMSAVPHSYPYTLDFIGNRLYGDDYKCLPHTRKEIITDNCPNQHDMIE